MAKLSTLQASLTAIADRLDKAKAEIVTEIQKLRDQLGDVDIPADAEATLVRLESLAGALDDINPDAPPTP